MIRLAEEKDINIINEFGVLASQNFLSTYDVNNYINNKDYIVLVNEDKKVLGFLLVSKNASSYDIEMIVTDPFNRRKGIATSLIDYFFDNYTKSGDEIFLEVAKSNEAAINLYKKFKFGVINERKNYYKNDDAFVMKKVI